MVLTGSALAFGLLQGRSVQLKLYNEVVGQTPEILGVNGRHFATGSNTMSRVRYLNANGIRLFINGNHFVSKPNNRTDMEPWGDGISSENAFFQRRADLRANPVDGGFIDWSYYRNRLESYQITGLNVFSVPHVLGLMKSEGIEVLSQTTISKAQLGFDSENDWASRWEYWKFYYAYTYLMIQEYGIRYYQMYNEPNHPASGIDDDFPGYLERLRLASDAIQSAAADFNTRYDKSVAVKIFAPVLASLNTTWTNAVASQLNTPLVDDGSGFDSLFHSFSYQQYNQNGVVFGNTVNNARSLVEAASGRANFEVSVTEFNVHTNATFSGMEETLDTPEKFSRLGNIYNGLIRNFADQLFVFKLSQTDGRDSIGIRKNGLAYVDNDGSPYDMGGMTGGFEVSRLYNEAFAGGHELLKVPTSNLPSSLSTEVSFLAARKDDGSYRLALANESDESMEWTMDLSEFNLTGDELLVIEEVSLNRLGEISVLRQLNDPDTLSFTQPPHSVWMVKILPVSNLEVKSRLPRFAASFTGDNQPAVFASSDSRLRARHHLISPAQRSVILLDFDIGYIHQREDARAFLNLRGHIEADNEEAVYHVYALRDGWRPKPGMGWSDVPYLRNGNMALTSPRINAGLVGMEEYGVQLVGTFRATSTFPQNYRIDVSDALRKSFYPWMVFLVSRDIRDKDDQTINSSSLVLSDYSQNESFAPHLQVYYPEGSGDSPFENVEANQEGVKNTVIGNIRDQFGFYAHHQQLGWIWPFTPTTGFLILQFGTSQWFWTNENIYPWSYNYSMLSWQNLEK